MPITGTNIGIVSNDHHFEVLGTIEFPTIDVISLQQFMKMII